MAVEGIGLSTREDSRGINRRHPYNSILPLRDPLKRELPLDKPSWSIHLGAWTRLGAKYMCNTGRDCSALHIHLIGRYRLHASIQMKAIYGCEMNGEEQAPAQRRAQKANLHTTCSPAKMFRCVNLLSLQVVYFSRHLPNSEHAQGQISASCLRQ